MRASTIYPRIHPRRGRYATVGYASLLLCLGLTPALSAGQDVDARLEAAPDATVEIENTSGSVEIRGWSNNEVRVTGRIGDDVEEFIAEGGRNRIVIEVEVQERGRWHNRDIESHLEVMVPNGARVEIETVSASVTVNDFAGRLEAETVSGSIGVAGALSNADLETVSGSIRLRGANTRTIAESVSGSIRLDGVSDRVEASTVSGTVEVEAGKIERGDLESVSGTVSLECSLARGARLDLSIHSGNVTLTLPADVSASFEAETFSGRIDNDFGPQAERTSKWVPSKSLEFTTGDGDAEVMLETFSGNLRIVRR